MIYRQEITIKDGRKCLLRNATVQDVEEETAIFRLTHEQTDFLRTYPDEGCMTQESQRAFLASIEERDNAIEILAFVDGKAVASAGFDCVGDCAKLRHRADFGISVDRAYWGLGIGRALTLACIECAKRAGYVQLELDVVADNLAAIALYKSVGFVEYGRNPKGFCSRLTGWQTLVLMRLELQQAADDAPNT